MPTASPYTNRLERKQGSSLQKPVDSWLSPEGQPHSWSTPAVGQSSSEVKPHLELWSAGLVQHSPSPWCCSQPRSGPAPTPSPVPAAAVVQPALPAASTGNQLAWNGLQLTAKPALTLAYMRKRSGNVSFGSPVGHSHFSISQQVSPTCLPTLSNAVKLITKHNRDQKPSLPIPCWCG